MYKIETEICGARPQSKAHVRKKIKQASSRQLIFDLI